MVVYEMILFRINCLGVFWFPSKIVAVFVGFITVIADAIMYIPDLCIVLLKKLRFSG